MASFSDRDHAFDMFYPQEPGEFQTLSRWSINNLLYFSSHMHAPLAALDYLSAVSAATFCAIH